MNDMTGDALHAGGEHAKFREMKEGTQEDWAIISKQYFEFAGGLALSSGNKDFGGLSGLRFLPGQDRIVAVTDAGHVFTASIKRDLLGAPVDLFDTSLDPIPGIGGFLSGLKQDSDCEAIEIGNNRAWLAFERKHRIESYDLRDGRPVGEPAPFNDAIRKLKLSSNRGIEALALMPAAGETQFLRRVS